MKYFALAAALLFWAMPSLALTQIAYVSSTGSDSFTTCTFDAPCATWQRAIAKTVAGGEVVALTSGDFGPMTILGSVNITVPEGLSVHVRGVDILAGPQDVIRLEGLQIDKKLYAKSYADSGRGVWIRAGFWFGVGDGARARVEIKDTRITGCKVGIEVFGDQIDVHLDNVLVSDFVDGGNGKAIWLHARSKMTLRQTRLVGGDIGFAWDDGHVIWSETAATTTSAIAFTTTPVKIRFTPPDGYFVGCGTLPDFQSGFNGPMIGSFRSDASNAPCVAAAAPWGDGF
jgi:hypothetical protein